VTYDDTEDVTDRERKIARGLAVAMHVGLVLLLVFGVAWQRRHSEPAAVVDLWSSLTPPKQEVAPPPKPTPKVEVKPEPKPTPPPPPKVEAKPQPKPDISLKEKLEKERKVKEQQELEKKKQLEQEKRKEDEKKKLETKKKEDEKQKTERERLAQEAEAKRAAQEKAELANKLAKEQAASQGRAFNEFVRRIQDKVRGNIVEPPNLQGSPQVEFEVRLLPGGEIMEGSVRLRRSSGNPAYDQAVERAIIRSSPLPVPPAGDPLFERFRESILQIRPR